MQNEFLTSEFAIDGQDTIEGAYRLGGVLGRSAGGVVYETAFGDGGQPAAIKVCRGDGGDSERLLEQWQSAMALSHPNLLRIYAAGASVLNDAPIIYVVMERAEESLAGALAQRKLSEEEVREMLSPTLAALSYLHKNGYAHGRIKASNVLAAGDTVKLSADSVSAAGDTAAAEDMRALGSLIVQALTQAPPRMDREGTYGLECSPALAEVVQHALEPDPAKRWMPEQIALRLRDPASVEDARTRGIPKWIYAGLAALVLLVVLLAVARKKDSVVLAPAILRAPVTDTTAPARTAAPLPPPVTPPAAVPESRATASAASQDGRGRRGSGWSVIVAAYVAREPADKRLRTMSTKWPKFQWNVFQQQADKTYYLVVIGQNLSEDEAQALRKKAVAAGLPRDTYIKKVM